MDRSQILLRSLRKDARIIEIGPSMRPLAPKRDGWNSFVVDHASREELIAKYASCDIAQIEEVDYVWKGGSVAEAVPTDQLGTFDAFIASHVIEHTTDIVTFLQAAQTLIKPDGIIILAVPDKRKNFDFYRHPSTTADALEAFMERRTRHSFRTQFEYGVRTVSKGGPGWYLNDTREPTFNAPFDRAQDALALAGQPDYVDAHNWIFVPSSFSLMVVELGELGHLDLQIEEMAEAYEAEFFAWLRKGRQTFGQEALQQRRKELMDLIVLELAEQARQIPGNPGFDHRIARYDQERIDELTFSKQAVQTVLAAARASTGWFGLDRKKFKQMILEASYAIPATGPATIQHRVLLEEATKVLTQKA